MKTFGTIVPFLIAFLILVATLLLISTRLRRSRLHTPYPTQSDPKTLCDSDQPAHWEVSSPASPLFTGFHTAPHASFPIPNSALRIYQLSHAATRTYAPFTKGEL